MPFPRCKYLSVLALLGVVALRAQMGDVLDKKGEVQASLVPRERIPPSPVLTPAQALAAFQLAPGLRIELVASEPLIEAPVAIAFGSDARLWVVEMRGYMPDFEGSTEDAPVGRIVVLTDDNGDGRYDRRTVFLDGLVLPRAIALVGDGALIGIPPLLQFWRDTDGDGRGDEMQVVADDYGVATDPKRPEIANPERAPNSLRWALDNWIYSTAYTKKFRYVGGRWESAPTIFRGQWGLSEDDFGRLYYNSNSDHLRADVIPSHYLGRNPNYPRAAGTNVLVPANQLVWPARVTPGTNRAYRPETMREGKLKDFTAACAPWIYRGDALPAEFYGNAFICDPAANLVKRDLLTATNGSVTAREAYDRKEFLASTDERFRPVNLTTGPDGALYIVDFQRGVIEHRVSLTSYLRKQAEDRGLVAPLNLGRIYRIVPATGVAPKAARLDRETPAQWVGHLSHGNAWRRETAQRLLSERGDASVVPPLRELARKGAAPLGRLHALGTLDGLKQLDAPTVLGALRDPAPEVRVTALRLSEQLLAGSARAAARTALLALPPETSADVLLQRVLTLGEVNDSAADMAAVRATRAAPENVFLRDALFSGLYGREWVLIEKLLGDATWAAEDAAANAILGGLARGVMNTADAASVDRLLAAIAAVPRAQTSRQIALLEGAAGATIVTAARPMQRVRQPEPLATLHAAATDATRGSLAKLDRLIAWPGKPGFAPPAVLTPLSTAEQARFETGRTIYAGTCLPCHQPHGRGIDGLAPPLTNSEWVEGSGERLVRIVLHGVRGPIRVDGRNYNLDMPPLGGLPDEDLAAVLTYVRRAWGNTGPPLTAEYIRTQRNDTRTRTEPWTQAELLKLP